MTIEPEINGIDPLLSLAQVMQLIPFSASHIYRLMRQNKFPLGVPLSESKARGRRIAWRKSHIANYIADPLAYRDDFYENSWAQPRA